MEETKETTEAPVLSVDLDSLKGHKTEDGLNFFTDEHLQSLETWGSKDPTKAKFRTEDGKIDVPKLTKSYLEMQKQYSKLSKPLPDDATEAERLEYHRNLARMQGVPDTPADYKIIPPELPEGMEMDKDAENELRITAHRHNMTNEGVQAVYDLVNKREVKRLEQFNQEVAKQNEEAETKVRAAVGSAEKYAASQELYDRYLRRFCSSDEEFETAKECWNRTLFNGGAATKAVFTKLLFDAAGFLEGEPKTLRSDFEQKLKENDEIKKQFPESSKHFTS